MEKYEKIEIETYIFENEDVIATSGTNWYHEIEDPNAPDILL